MKKKTTLFVALMIAMLALTASMYWPGLRARAASSTTDDLDRSMKAVAAVFSLVEQNYADPVSSEKAFFGDHNVGGAIPGMLHTLDPHSNFVDPAEYRDMQRRQHAQYFGVGMQITMDGPKTVVMEPFPGSPAWNADLRRGDWIVAVDGKDATTLDSQAVAEMLRGPRGTQVRVSVRREGASEPVSVTVTRGEIETSVVDAFWVKPGIVDVKVTSFEAQNLGRDVEAQLQKLGEASVNGLVLDLRGNMGGLVNEAVALGGRFLRNGQTVVSHRGRAEQEQVFRAKAQAAAQKYPVVVLVDRLSASASEIVAGALQDHDRAWLLGETTFGKGLVQAQFPLSEGAALLLTIAHYYTPSGRLIQRDYQHQSFFDYYSHRTNPTNTDDVKATDAGRKVFGGGGITPDEQYDSPKLSLFQRRLLNNGAFYHFGSVYFGAVKPHLTPNWQPDGDTMARFKEFLQKQPPPFTFTDADLAKAQDWLREQIRYELYFRAFDRKTAERARWVDDPEVHKAIDSMPKAESLLKTSQRLYALRVPDHRRQ